MLLNTTPGGNSDSDGRSHLFSLPLDHGASSDPEFEPAIDFAFHLAQRYELSSLAPLLASVRSAVSQRNVSVAVVGRFKAGKSSFLNHFTNRSILPAGVVPVTAVVTEIRFGPVERAAVHFMDGRAEELAVESFAEYVSERETRKTRNKSSLLPWNCRDWNASAGSSS